MSLYLTLLSIIQPKDHVIYISPCYTSYLPQILLSETDVEITSFDLNKEFKIDYDKLKKNFRKNTKAIIINFPHNPTGQILSQDDLSQFTKLLREFKNVILSLMRFIRKMYLVVTNIYHQLLSKVYQVGSLQLVVFPKHLL